jgi:hypothetical protein
MYQEVLASQERADDTVAEDAMDVADSEEFMEDSVVRKSEEEEEEVGDDKAKETDTAVEANPFEPTQRNSVSNQWVPRRCTTRVTVETTVEEYGSPTTRAARRRGQAEMQPASSTRSAVRKRSPRGQRTRCRSRSPSIDREEDD